MRSFLRTVLAASVLAVATLPAAGSAQAAEPTFTQCRDSTHGWINDLNFAPDDEVRRQWDLVKATKDDFGNYLKPRYSTWDTYRYVNIAGPQPQDRGMRLRWLIFTDRARIQGVYVDNNAFKVACWFHKHYDSTTHPYCETEIPHYYYHDQRIPYFDPWSFPPNDTPCAANPALAATATTPDGLGADEALRWGTADTETGWTAAPKDTTYSLGDNVQAGQVTGYPALPNDNGENLFPSGVAPAEVNKNVESYEECLVAVWNASLADSKTKAAANGADTSLSATGRNEYRWAGVGSTSYPTTNVAQCWLMHTWFKPTGRVNVLYKADVVENTSTGAESIGQWYTFGQVFNN